jgi:hypothetical protein
VTNNKIIKISGGAIASISLGGIVAVSWKNPLYASIPVNNNQNRAIRDVMPLLFTALIKRKKVKITVKQKIMAT